MWMVWLLGLFLHTLPDLANPGFNDKYERDCPSSINRHRPDNPLNPINAVDPKNPFNSMNRVDPGNPRIPSIASTRTIHSIRSTK